MPDVESAVDRFLAAPKRHKPLTKQVRGSGRLPFQFKVAFKVGSCESILLGKEIILKV